MGRAHNDDKGYDRGARGIDGRGLDNDFQMPKSPKARQGYDCAPSSLDYGNGPIRELTKISQDIGCGEYEGYKDQQWKPGPVSSGGKWHKFNNGPPQPPATTKQTEAYSPSGKYGKKGGSGQRSGA